MTMSRIFQINASQGGVPKLPLAQAAVNADGLTCDAQEHLDVHGGPDRALCLYSLERILALQNEGHPIFPGAAGENLTLVGLDWDTVAPGVVLQLGGEVVVEIVSYTQPCGTISAFFTDGRPARIAQKSHPGWSRVYARVVRGGEIAVADEVVIGG